MPRFPPPPRWVTNGTTEAERTFRRPPHRNNETTTMPRPSPSQSITAFRQFIAQNPEPCAYPRFPIARARAYAAAVHDFWQAVYANPILAGGPDENRIEVINGYLNDPDNVPDAVPRIRDVLLDMIRTDTIEAYQARMLARVEDARHNLNGRLIAVINDVLPGRQAAMDNIVWPALNNLLVFVPMRNSNAHNYELNIPVRFSRPHTHPAGMFCVRSGGLPGNVLKIYDCRPPTETELARFVQAEIQGVAYENVETL